MGKYGVRFKLDTDDNFSPNKQVSESETEDS